MNKPKNLHMGKCLEDLKYNIPDCSKTTIKRLILTAQMLYDSAYKEYNDRDEEMSYIYFMKYLNVMNTIKKQPDFSRDREYYTKLIGSKSKIDDVFLKLELLQKSLLERYIETYPPMKNEISFKEQNTVRPEPQIIDNRKLNFNRQEESITVHDLYKLIQNKEITFLIMDCRSTDEHNASELKYPHCFVPSEILGAGMTAGKIQNQLSQEAKSLWASRSYKDYIILMDTFGTSLRHNLPQKQPINILKNVLLNWDQDVEYKNEILILKGGYSNFCLTYPTLSLNPHVQQQVRIMEDPIINLDDIEYKTFDDMPMKNTLMFGQDADIAAVGNFRPTIDRSNKSNAIKTYDLMIKHEELLDKSLRNEQAAIATQHQLNEVLTYEENIPENLNNAAEEKAVEDETQTIVNQLIEYEAKTKEYENEIRHYKQLLKEKEREDAKKGEYIQELEARQLEKEASERIARKERDQQIILEQKKLLAQERDRKLLLAREKKPRWQLEDTISTPQFDRTIKPSVQNSYVSENIIRDFAPEVGKMGRGLTGLKNLGNTCYMNSIMQCLSNTTSLVDYLITNTYRKDINRSNTTQGRIVEEVSAVMKEIWCNQYRCIASKDLRCIVGQFQQIFRGMDQQDSHEFLTILMDWLHSDLQTINMNVSPRDKLTASDKAWLEFIKYKESYILKLFYGQIKSTVKCKVCQGESATYDSFSNLSLELPQNSNRCNIEDCLNMYFYGEPIRGWNCPNCKVKRDAIKKLDISKLPQILVIHFKRFYVDSDSAATNTYKKKQNYVSFPLNNLNVRNYVVPSERDNVKENYNLYGVSNHYGTMERGHYTAFCKSSIVGKWYKYDDHNVSQLDESDVVSSAGYILFYTKHDNKPPKLR